MVFMTFFFMPVLVSLGEPIMSIFRLVAGLSFLGLVVRTLGIMFGDRRIGGNALAEAKPTDGQCGPSQYLKSHNHECAPR